MLKLEDLQKHEKLSGTDVNILKVIVGLSEADDVIVRKEVRDTVTGELAGGVERDFLAITNIEKKSGESYFNYLKRGTQSLVQDLAASKTKIEDFTKRVGELEEAAKGASTDEVLKQQLATAKQDLVDEKGRTEALQTQLTTAKTEHEKEIGKVHGTYLNDHVLTVFKSQLIGKTPRAGLDEKAMEEIATGRFEKALADHKTERHGDAIRFRRGEEVLKNAEDGMKDHTPESFAMSLLSDLISAGKPGSGAGGSGSGGGSGGGAVELVNAKSQVQATEIINKSLAAQGITTSDDGFQDKFDAMWKEGNVEKLPLQATE